MRTIEVTQFHINTGVHGSFCDCPISLALKDAGFTDVYVSPKMIKHSKGYILPNQKMAHFMRDFDKLQAVKPFSFVVA